MKETESPPPNDVITCILSHDGKACFPGHPFLAALLETIEFGMILDLLLRTVSHKSP